MLGGVRATSRWCRCGMRGRGTHTVVVGGRGRIVIPAEMRERAGLAARTPLVLLGSSGGLLLLTREQRRARVVAELDDLDLVSEMLADRCRAAGQEDAA